MKHNINKTKQRVASEKKETSQSSNWSFKVILESVVAVITIFGTGFGVGSFFTSRDNRFEFVPISCHFLQSCATAKTSILEMRGLWLLSIIFWKSTPLPSQWHLNGEFRLLPSM